ncbi:cleavage and polyadenylation specificity factor subunit 1, partial [Lecanoromycetidae sp. Uapishka_2]
MQCYNELTPPTSVTHSLSLPFLSPSANNLIIAKTNILQIFSLKSVIIATNDTTNQVQSSSAANGANPSKTDSATARPDRQHTTKLVFVGQYELAGTITSLARVKILQSRSGGEALLVSLRDAKLSLIEWDPERYNISTISIHYYEREDILSSPWEPDLPHCINYLSVDPSSRCAVLKFGMRHLAIIPFHQIGDDLVGDDLDIDDYDPDIDGERPGGRKSVSKVAPDDIATAKTPYSASFVLSLLALDPNLSHPLHLCFLFEYREPTFGVLYSQVASSTALLSERRDNVSYAVYTLDLEQRASTTLLSITSLPYDLFAVIPLSRRIGGALLMGGNEIIHVDQSGKTTAVAVNEFARQSSSFAMADQSDLNMRLEHCVIKELGSDSTDLLLILNSGELAVLSFKIDGRSVSGVSIRRISMENGGHAILAGASCASVVGRGRIFVGSEDCDSYVLGWSRATDRSRRQKPRTILDIDGDQDDLDLDEEDIEDDDDDFDTEFESDAGATIDIGIVGGGAKTMQVLESELRIYDGDFGLAQILPLVDEESDEETPKVISARFADPYALLITEDSGALVLTEDASGDLEIIDKGDALKTGKWISGCLYEDSNDALRLEFPEDSDDEAGNTLLFLLTAAGGLQGKSHAAQLPLHSQYDTGWVTQRIPLGQEVHALSYQPEKDAYILGTSTTVPFRLPEDEFHIEWANEETSFLPLCEQGSVKLLDGKSLSVIDTYALAPYEVVTTIKTLSLEVSEHTHTRETLVCVGTALIRGEDLPSAGKIYCFAVIDVVPEPDRPETGHALKLIAKEDVKAAVTALSSVGTQGFLLVAQGQKCMVRGLKEDGSILPVAFMDMQCYVSVVKELPGTGMCLMGDAVKGIWLTGYMEEPYSLRVFGKSPRHIEVIAADLLPDSRQLFIAVADADCNLHVLQFDPENAKSLSGQRLLHHSTFHISHFPSTLTLL